MQVKMKDIIITIGFIMILTIVFLVNIISKDKEISVTERRKLAQFPEITYKKIVNGDTMKNWEKYVEDQFAKRDFFRSLKSFWSINVFRQKDNNNLFKIDDAIYKLEYPLNEKNVQKSAERIKAVYEKYLKDMNVYYSIIPDKNYYLENDDHLKIDYDKLQQIVQNELNGLTYIDIRSGLKLTDYYKTDLHWKQENLQEVVDIIQTGMNMEKGLQTNYEMRNMGEFYGAYYGQLGVDVPPDNLYILTNDTIEDCTTYNFETKRSGKVYDTNISADKYDIFLSGATPLISVENPNARNNKELLLFRDSFGSSIAPLLIENYSKITLIDLRYMSSQLLSEFIEFEDQDVLFLYSGVVLRQNVLK